MRWRKRPDQDDDKGFDGTTPAPASTRRITPLDIQEKEFHRSSRSRGGYVMREVDEFLDEVTDTLSAVIAENERLRSVTGASPAPAPVGEGSDPVAVEAFLRREKAFLQELGALVQGHTQELKTMVRSARTSAAAGAQAPALAEPGPSEAEDDAVAAGATGELEPAQAAEEATTAEEPTAAEVPAAAEEPTSAEQPQADAEDAEAAAATRGAGAEGSDEPAVTISDAEEPIRLEEPTTAPTRRRGSEDDPERSLRELFWGEE